MSLFLAFSLWARNSTRHSLLSLRYLITATKIHWEKNVHCFLLSSPPLFSTALPVNSSLPAWAVWGSLKGPLLSAHAVWGPFYPRGCTSWPCTAEIIELSPTILCLVLPLKFTSSLVWFFNISYDVGPTWYLIIIFFTSSLRTAFPGSPLYRSFWLTEVFPPGYILSVPSPDKPSPPLLGSY